MPSGCEDLSGVGDARNRDSGATNGDRLLRTRSRQHHLQQLRCFQLQDCQRQCIVCSFVRSFVRSIIHSFIHSFIHPSIHPSIHPFIHSLIHNHSLIHSIVHRLIKLRIECINHVIWKKNLFSETHCDDTGFSLMSNIMVVIIGLSSSPSS